MFDYLKKKISGWIGKSEEGEKEAPKAEAKKEEALKKEPVKKEKESKKDTKRIKRAGKKGKKEEKKKDQIRKKAQAEAPEEAKTEYKEKAEEEKEEGFFSKLFKKKEKTEEVKEEFRGKSVEAPQIEVKIPQSKTAPVEVEKAEPEYLEVEEREEEVSKEEGFFRRLIGKISTSELTVEEFDEIFMELELTLLESNVALEAVDRIRGNLSKSLVGKHFKKAEAATKVIEALKDSILDLLIEPPNLIEEIKKKESIFTILFFGINGTGKTTSIAKIAHLLKKNGISCVLAAGDTFRAASIEQLQTHGQRIGVPVVSSKYGADPASVVFDAKKYAQAHGIKVVLIDTAGRMYTKENLLKEMEKIVRVSEADLKIFVGESITGNDAVEQARSFNESAGIDGIILSKADIDEKAGAILSVSHVTGKPIYYLGVGQGYDDLEVFSKKNVLKNLGLG